MTPEQLERWQGTAVDWFGEPLVCDGKLGPKTQWALDLRSNGPMRERVIRTALEHIGVTEQPPGSNRGTMVDLFLAPAGIEGQPWCAAFVSWVLREARQPWSKYHVSVAEMAHAERQVTGRAPLVGDVFYILRPDGAGHCGFVMGVNPGEIMTLEGNCNNAVRVGRRDTSKLSGYLDIEPTQARTPVVSSNVPDLDGIADR